MHDSSAPRVQNRHFTTTRAHRPVLEVHLALHVLRALDGSQTAWEEWRRLAFSSRCGGWRWAVGARKSDERWATHQR